jgi:ribosome-associated protein
VLLDFGDIIAHIFHEEDRMYYALERLWKDCPAIALDIPGVENVVAPVDGSESEASAS